MSKSNKPRETGFLDGGACVVGVVGMVVVVVVMMVRVSRVVKRVQRAAGDGDGDEGAPAWSEGSDCVACLYGIRGSCLQYTMATMGTIDARSTRPAPTQPTGRRRHRSASARALVLYTTPAADPQPTPPPTLLSARPSLRSPSGPPTFAFLRFLSPGCSPSLPMSGPAATGWDGRARAASRGPRTGLSLARQGRVGSRRAGRRVVAVASGRGGDFVCRLSWAQ